MVEDGDRNTDDAIEGRPRRGKWVDMISEGRNGK